MKHLFPVNRRARSCASAALLFVPVAVGAQRPTGTLAGRVLSGDVAVPSATIVVSGGRATLARVDGRYRMPLPEGRYTVRASHVGYTSASDTIVVVAGQTATLNFKLERADSPLEAVSSIGSDRTERAVIDALRPTEVFQAADLKATGRTQLSEMIQMLVPAFAVSHADNAVGSASIRGASYRGLSNDELLVLVNGKRRHASALLNTSDAIGRGTAAVDLDAIPPGMVERVEIVSGSAAQFGSGAIAGVINVVLKSGVHGDATGTLGERASTYNRADGTTLSPYPSGERSVTDGRTQQAAIDKGVVFGERGFLHGAFEYRDEGYSNRSLPDLRPLYAPGDPRATQSPLDPERMLWLRGRPQQRDAALFLNGGNLLASGLELYGNAGLSRREGKTSPFFVRSNDSYSYTATYPDGYRPLFTSTSDDISGTVGLRGFVDEWKWDLGTTYGMNQLRVRGQDGLNNNIAAPTESGLTGTLRNSQWITTLDVSRIYSVFDELHVDAGAEFTADRFEMQPRESATYDPIGFRSFTAPDTTASRHDIGGYLDLEAALSRAFTLGVNARADHFSDFGSVAAGGLSARYEVMPQMVLRAAAGTGFHAPELVQAQFTHKVDYLNGPRLVVPSSTAGTGAPPITIERSRNVQGGVALEPTSSLSLTVDAYRTEVRGRSLLAFHRADVPTGVMANVADTRTDGVTAEANHVSHLANGATLRLIASGDFHKSSILRADTVSLVVRPAIYPSPSAPPVVDRAELLRLTNGQPQANLLFSGRYDLGMLGALVRTQRFGGVSVGDSLGTATAQDFGAKWITDASVSLKLHRLYTLTVGADNIFDVYPDRNNRPGDPANTGAGAGNGFYGILPYNPVSPFGYSGRYIYGRFSFYL